VERLDSSVTLGVPLAPTLRVLADDVRQQYAIGLGEDVRRASMRVLIPLAVVVLPASVLACLVPLFARGLQGISGQLRLIGKGREGMQKFRQFRWTLRDAENTLKLRLG